MEFLRSEDPLEILVTQMLAKKVDELVERRDRSRANMIANAVGHLFP